MADRYLKEPFRELYLDISSGHNIYVSALLEAGRLFLTFYKLQNFYPSLEPLEVFLCFSDPILLTSADKTYELHHRYKLEVKAFFSWPRRPDEIKLENAYPTLIKELSGEDRNLKRYLTEKLASLLTRGYLFFSALKNATPLVLYTFPYHQEEEILTVMQEMINFLKERLFSYYLNTPRINTVPWRQLFLMLTLYLGIVRALKAYKIYPKDEVSTTELGWKFRSHACNLFKYFELDTLRDYFSQELKNNFWKDEMFNKFQPEYKLLKEFIGGEKSDELTPRNFRAHCGFERNCVEVKKINGEVIVRYVKDEEILKRIQKILLEI